jgi:exopolysaccharide production protein ExoQ
MRNLVAASELSGATGLAFAVGFYFSFRTILVLLSVRFLGSDPRTGSEMVLGADLLLLLVACFCCLGHANRTCASMLRLPSIRWVLLFLGLSLFSLAWSDTVSLQTSAAYWSGMAADVGIVILLLRSGSLAGVSHSLMKGFIWSVCCLAVIAWIMPAQADLRLGDEDFFNTNQIGNLCAVAILFAQYLMRRREGRWWRAILLLALTLLRSLSKTTIVAFLLSESLLIMQDRSITRKTKLLLTTGVILAILVFWGLFAAYYDVYTNAGNQAETLTGRTAIWAYVLNAALERPWIGHGFDSMWKVVPPFGSDQFEARHAENELLQQFYAYGVMGVLMLLALYGSLYRRIRRLPPGPLKVVFRSMLLFVFVRGLAEAEPFDLLLPLWLIVLISTLIEDAVPSDQDAITRSTAVHHDGSAVPQRLATQE